MFERYLALWNLIPDGQPLVTASSQLLPVLRGREPAMLKLTIDEEENRGAALMDWWGGRGAARVLCRDNEACLLERATGRARLPEMARSGRDEETVQILCSVAAQLHVPQSRSPPNLVPLSAWFGELEPAAVTSGGVLARCAETARMLLAEPLDVRVLHGDLHHGNVLDFGRRGWLAIDPKGLIGERGFDFANIFLNPDLAAPDTPLATIPAVLEQRLAIVTSSASLQRHRLLQWIMAWAGLSAAWLINDGICSPINRDIAEMVAAALDQ